MTKKCCVCKKTIKKGDIRLNTGGGGYRGPVSRYHQKCFCKTMLPYITMGVIVDTGRDEFDKTITKIYKENIIKNLGK